MTVRTVSCRTRKENSREWIAAHTGRGWDTGHHFLLRVHALIAESIFALLATAQFGAYAVSMDQRIVFWNRAAERMLGFPAEEVLGQHCYEVVTGRPAAGVTAACMEGCPSLQSLQSGGMPGAVRMELPSASGESASLVVTPMLLGGGPDDTPLIVHLFDDGSTAAPPEGAAEIEDDDEDGWMTGAEALAERRTRGPRSGGADSLTARELEVLRLVALGQSTITIATDLGISEHTVRNHVRNFRRKLNAPTKLEAVLTAFRRGLLELQ